MLPEFWESTLFRNLAITLSVKTDKAHCLSSVCVIREILNKSLTEIASKRKLRRM